MTATRDSDRILRAWLDLMPDEAPDRVIADVLEAIDATPQPRRTRWWPTWRSTPMNRSLAALGAAAVIVVVGTILVIRPGSQPSVGTSNSLQPSVQPSQPGSSPSASASVVAVGGPVPAELIGRWMGSNNAYVTPGAGSSMVLVSDSLGMSQSNANANILLQASAGLVDGNLELTANGSRYSCSAGDVGTYSWTRSTSGRILTITAIQDACVARQAAMAGTWWKSDCHNPGTDCLGDLDPGTYDSQYIRPMLGPGQTWSPKFGGVIYTVPDGWANHADWPGYFGLTSSTDYARTTAAAVDPTNAIDVLTDPVGESQAIPCSGKPDTKVALTVAAEIASLRHVPGLLVSPSTSLTIDGHPATSVDLSVDPAKAGNCGGDRVAEYLIAGGEGHGIVASQRHRLILVDLGGGHLVAVTVESADATQFDAFAATAMPIVQSLHFQ